MSAPIGVEPALLRSVSCGGPDVRGVPEVLSHGRHPPLATVCRGNRVGVERNRDILDRFSGGVPLEAPSHDRGLGRTSRHEGRSQIPKHLSQPGNLPAPPPVESLDTAEPEQLSSASLARALRAALSGAFV